MPETSLSGKTVVVGGASRNLGALISTTVARDGANVVVHYNSDSSAAKAADVVAAVEESGARAISHQADLSDSAAVSGLFDAAEAEFGQVHAVVNTAGKVIKKPMAEVTDAEFDEMFAVNSKTAFLVMREASKRVADSGKIVTIVTSLLAVDDPLDLAVPVGHRLTTRARVTLRDAATESWIVANPHSAYHRLSLAACQAAGFRPSIAHHADEWDTGAALVAHGLGVFLLPRLAPMHRPEQVVRIPLAGPSAPERRIVALTRAGTGDQPAIAYAHATIIAVHETGS